MNEKNYLALLHKIGLNHKKLHIIFENNNNYKEFYDKISSNILYTYGFTPKQIDLILDNKIKSNINNIDAKLKEREVDIVVFSDLLYPENLRQIFNPPFLLYIRGRINKGPKISVVGTRKISSYGKRIIEKIIPDISSYFTIVSGGAAGCDTYAHDVTLNYNNRTISVIGTGIDVDYPVGNKKLYNKIVKFGGAIISIFPLGEFGNPYNFPVRNEIVAGLSVGTLIIEAQVKSGTLITANLALDLGKELFAVPGDIFKTGSVGCNNLIKKGMAKSISNSGDLLDEFNISNKCINKKASLVFNDKIEESIYELVMIDNLNIDEIGIKLNIDISLLTLKISLMEINKLIKKGIGGKYEIF